MDHSKETPAKKTSSYEKKIVNGKNNSKIRVWAYHTKITDYPNIKGSNLTPYLKKGYRNSEGIDFKTEYLWMWVELLEKLIKP